MGRVYSYLRFSDPRQAAGSSADRQMEYARRWAADRGMVLDESLSLRDEGLSAYHQRHVTQGALGVFLRAVEDGRIVPGSVLVVEGLDRLSRAEPLKAQAQLTQIVHAGIVVVTAADGQEYSLEAIRANPYKLIHSLVVMIRAHEESDTKSKRVRAAIRRQCEGWLAGTWRGVIRNGKDPHWVEWDGTGWRFVPALADAMREAVRLYMQGDGAVHVLHDLAARGLTLTRTARSSKSSLMQTFRRRALVGEKTLRVDGHEYVLAGYYPALLTEDEFQALQLLLDRRSRRRGPAEIPSLFTGLGVAVCGYCGGALVTSNMMSRRKQPNGQPWPGHRRIACANYTAGRGICPAPGTIQAAPVERAVMMLCADQIRMDALHAGGDAGQALRAELAACRAEVAQAEAKLSRLAAILEADAEMAPMTVLRQMRGLEAQAEAGRQRVAQIERELAGWRPAPTPNQAEEWLALMDGVEALDRPTRLRARELVRDSLARIVLWHRGDPMGAEGGEVMDLEVTGRGGGVMRFRLDRSSGGLIEVNT